jgi:hypothetical protein
LTRSLQSNQHVPVIRHGNDDCVDVRPSQQCAEIAVRGTGLVAVMRIDQFFCSTGMTVANVAHPNDPDILMPKKRPNMSGAHVSNANEAKGDTVTWRDRAAEPACRSGR